MPSIRDAVANAVRAAFRPTYDIEERGMIEGNEVCFFLRPKGAKRKKYHVIVRIDEKKIIVALYGSSEWQVASLDKPNFNPVTFVKRTSKRLLKAFFAAEEEAYLKQIEKMKGYIADVEHDLGLVEGRKKRAKK
jgi:hypothetical protein